MRRAVRTEAQEGRYPRNAVKELHVGPEVERQICDTHRDWEPQQSYRTRGICYIGLGRRSCIVWCCAGSCLPGPGLGKPHIIPQIWDGTCLTNMDFGLRGTTQAGGRLLFQRVQYIPAARHRPGEGWMKHRGSKKLGGGSKPRGRSRCGPPKAWQDTPDSSEAWSSAFAWSWLAELRGAAVW